MEQDQLRRTLLFELHRFVDDAATVGMEMLDSGIEPVYPPGAVLTDAQLAARAALRLTPPVPPTLASDVS